MKQIAIPCIIISFASEIVKGIIKNNKLNYLIDSITGVLIIVVFISYTTQKSPFSNYDFELTSDDFSYSFENTMGDIVEYTEKNLKGELIKKVKDRFGVEPYECKIVINKETLSVESAELIFYNTDKLVSNYSIKNYIKQSFNIDAEVIFY